MKKPTNKNAKKVKRRKAKLNSSFLVIFHIFLVNFDVLIYYINTDIIYWMMIKVKGISSDMKTFEVSLDESFSNTFRINGKNDLKIATGCDV